MSTYPLIPASGSSVVLTADVNTYVTLAEADAYMDGRLNAGAWTAASVDDKARALITATRDLGNLTLKFRKTVPTQTLDFPRWVPVGPSSNDWPFSYATYNPSVVPPEVKDSECEEALALLKYGSSERANLQAQGVTSITLGKMQESYAPKSRHGLLSPDAHRMMQPWIAGAVRIQRGR